MKFYSVKQRKSVFVKDDQCVKVKKAKPNGGVTYMALAKDENGGGLAKILSEKDWKALKCKEQ